MESMEWYGTVHMDSMDYSMDSIWNGMEQSMYGTVHMDSMDYSMESIWNGTFSKNSLSST